MITKDLSTLKIHKLTQEQYDREFDEGNLDETAIYLTPDEENDLSLYATIEQLDGMEFISTDDIDTICGGVTEEGLPSSDIDELMAQLR